jgi:hypothetical protein
MIRVAKPLQLLEWGEGTNTLNQVWRVAGEGKITRHVVRDGKTTLIVELKAPLDKKNDKDKQLKLAQPGEGMTGGSDRWGEVALGELAALEQGGRVVTVQIRTATKIDARK